MENFQIGNKVSFKSTKTGQTVFGTIASIRVKQKRCPKALKGSMYASMYVYDPTMVAQVVPSELNGKNMFWTVPVRVLTLEADIGADVAKVQAVVTTIKTIREQRQAMIVDNNARVAFENGVYDLKQGDDIQVKLRHRYSGVFWKDCKFAKYSGQRRIGFTTKENGSHVQFSPAKWVRKPVADTETMQQSINTPISNQPHEIEAQ